MTSEEATAAGCEEPTKSHGRLLYLGKPTASLVGVMKGPRLSAPGRASSLSAASSAVALRGCSCHPLRLNYLLPDRPCGIACRKHKKG
jgi:hypothetical protein